jgi:hypothetical protein
MSLLAAAIAVPVLLAPAAALALPVFGSASLAPDAISPNGDDVQDFTVIDYSVATDSADVRILLSLAGGAVVDTLQAFTRRGMGPHTLVFDGTGSSGPVPDGLYEVKIVGVGTQGEGNETATLPLEIDRVAPVLTWDLVLPAQPVIQNGTTLTLQACVDADTVYVDLSALDSAYDPGQVSETLVPPNCTRFTYTVSTLNTLADAAGLPSIATARDRAGNIGTASLDLCLSNSPPTVVSTVLLNSSPFLQNGDQIQAEIEFSSPGILTASGDFSNLDSDFNPADVISIPLGGQRFEIRYRISDTNTNPDQDYKLHLIGNDQGCGVAQDSSLVITLDNAGVNSSLVDNVFLNTPAFSPTGNGINPVEIHFTVLEDTVLVGIATDALLQNPPITDNILILSPQPFTRGPHTAFWDGSGGPIRPPERLAEQDLDLVLRAISLPLARQRSIIVPLEVDNTSPELLTFPPAASLRFKNNQVTEVPVNYDQSGYQITADFGGVDSNFNPGGVAVVDSGGGAYGIFYSISPTNTLPDTIDVPIPLTAVDRAGNFTGPLLLVRGCIDNLPPVFVSAALTGNQGPFTKRNRITLEARWSSEPHQSSLDVTADFSAIDDRSTRRTRSRSW